MNAENQAGRNQPSGRAALNLAGRTLWHLPGRFGIARLLGPRYSLRCVLFHDVSDTESSFTKGLGGTITRKDFEAALRFITRHYTPVSLQDVIADSDGQALPPRPVLVTFDDAYASVSEFAAPLCSKFGVPAVFFVNGACLDNRQLALDNLVCYVANVCGLGTINAAAHVASGTKDIELRSLTEVFARFLPAISLSAREVFRGALLQLARINEGDLAAEAGLYLSSRQLRDLATFNFEIGNHTYSHANCRALSAEDFAGEIDRNKAVSRGSLGKEGAFIQRALRLLSRPHRRPRGAPSSVRIRGGFSLREPCQSARARTGSVLTGLASGLGNDGALFSEIEVLPRLRTIRNSLFGAANVEPCGSISDLEDRRQPSWPCTSEEHPGIGAEVPRANPEA